MKRNGFTLIELVTVIAMLSIIGLVLAPKISTAFQTTHADQLEEIRQRVGSAIEVYLNRDCGSNSHKELIEKDKVKIYLTNIVDCGLIKNKMYNPVSGNYFDVDKEYVEAYIDEVGLIEYKMSF